MKAHFWMNAFGLAFDVVKSEKTSSGFEPAATDLGSGKELFGRLRLEGFAALMKSGLLRDRLTIVGGNEGRYKDEAPIINRAATICRMLAMDYGIDHARLMYRASASNTGGNIAIIAECGDMLDMVVTSHYHLPRVTLDLALANASRLVGYPAEAFILLQDEGRKTWLVEQFGGGLLAERMAEEIQGIAHKIKGVYKPRTDNPSK